MKKMIVIWGILLIGTWIAFADIAPKITIVSPSEGYPLIKNETIQIKWTHSAYFDIHPQTCRIYCGSYIISPPIPVINDLFTWTVGKKADGTYFPQGKYEFTIESPDFDALNGPTMPIVDEDAYINITVPADGTPLTIGSKCMIRWTHSSYYHVLPQTCEIFCGDFFISPPVAVLDDKFEWTVGKKEDGTILAPGSYPITLESDDYDELSGPHVILSAFAKIPVRHFRTKIPLYIDPGCPMCFRLDPRDLKFEPVGMEPVTIEIVRGGQVFARLGKFGRGLALPGQVKITLDKPSFNFIKSRRPGYELRVISAQGKILKQQAIQLEIVK